MADAEKPVKKEEPKQAAANKVDSSDRSESSYNTNPAKKTATKKEPDDKSTSEMTIEDLSDVFSSSLSLNPNSTQVLETIMNLYASTGSDSNHEGRKNNNEANPSLRRDVRKATDKLGTGADASYKVGTVKGVVQIKADALDKLRSRMRARLSHQSLADFMAACSPPETAFDPISFYFACHKTKVPPSPTVVSNNDGNTFFYWKPIEDKIKSKDDKLRLVPSLWSAEDSEKIVALWEQLEPEEKKKDYSRQASKFFGVEGEVDAKFDRAFLAAVSVYLIRSNDTWKTWFNKNHPRGEPDFVNIVLGHLKRSSEWQAYWKYIIS